MVLQHPFLPGFGFGFGGRGLPLEPTLMPNGSYRVTPIPNMAAKVEKVESDTNVPVTTPGEENKGKPPVFE